MEHLYEVQEFKGYSVTADESTIAEIAASPEVSFLLFNSGLLKCKIVEGFELTM